MYVLLDGYDLGIGTLLLAERDEGRRREMVEIVATAWDGNESWLILFAVAFWGGFPAAFGVLLPAMYIPVIVMLFALIFRGVAIEVISAANGVPRGWGYAFGIGSLVAAFAQGMAIGGVLSGVTISHGGFAGGSFDFFGPYSLLTGITTVAVYCMAGAAVLQLKTEGELRARSGRTGRTIAVFTALLVTISALSLEATAVPVQLGVTWRAVVFAVLAAIGACAFLFAWVAFGRRPDTGPLIGLVTASATGLAALIIAVYPALVPPDLTVYTARAPATTLEFMLFGVGCNIPLLLFYGWMAHHVFRGKYRLPAENRPAGVPASGHALSPHEPGEEVAAS